jgi:hypothetical protein
VILMIHCSYLYIVTITCLVTDLSLFSFLCFRNIVVFGYSIFISSAAAICYVNLLPRLSKKCLRYSDIPLTVFFSTIWSALLFVFKISESCFMCYCTFRFLLICYETVSSILHWCFCFQDLKIIIL